MKKVKGIFTSALVISALCFGQASHAQQDATTQQTQGQEQTSGTFSDAELEQFVKANEKATAIQKESHKAIVAAIEEENLTIERFNEIAQAHQQKKIEDLQASPEELASFNNAAKQVIALQPETKKNVEQAISEEGLTVEKYDKIMLAYEKNPVVKAKVQKFISEK